VSEDCRPGVNHIISLQRTAVMSPQIGWPDPSCLIDVSRKFQLNDGSARCVRLAVCSAEGRPSSRFRQGETAHLFYEFELLRDIGVPAGGAELVTPEGVVVHGKSCYQYPGLELKPLAAGTRLRFHQAFQLWLAPGRYQLNVGLASAEPEVCRHYLAGNLPYEQFARRLKDHCRLLRAATLEVSFGANGALSHHGLADLPGELHLDCLPAEPAPPLPEYPAPNGPTVLHITHWKAGSQWIAQILRDCMGQRIIEPELGEAQVRHYPIQRGFVYPAVYLSREEFEALSLPENTRWFVVIRDLRDTLVSAYFSFKISHPVLGSELASLRQKLWEIDQEAGFLYLMDHFLEKCARIQLSWLEAGEPLLKYEHLLRDDLGLLSEVLIDRCGLPVSRERLREVVAANRFEAQTGGRRRGVEDVSAHQRKAVPGDWRNHFTERVKRAFKARYGGLLVATGYEKNLKW